MTMMKTHGMVIQLSRCKPTQLMHHNGVVDPADANGLDGENIRLIVESDFNVDI